MKRERERAKIRKKKTGSRGDFKAKRSGARETEGVKGYKQRQV